MGILDTLLKGQGANDSGPLPELFLLNKAADYEQQGYAKAKSPGYLREEYKGHGHTYHNWYVPEPELQLAPVGALPDLLLNDLNHPIVSERLSQHLEQQRHFSDIISWLNVKVHHPDAQLPYDYYILHLPYRLKCLAWRSNHFDENGQMLTMPPVSGSVVGEHKIFTYLLKSRRNDVLMRREVKDSIEQGGFTGLSFLKAQVTHDRIVR